jgi:hypothetical protein
MHVMLNNLRNAPDVRLENRRRFWMTLALFEWRGPYFYGGLQRCASNGSRAPFQTMPRYHELNLCVPRRELGPRNPRCDLLNACEIIYSETDIHQDTRCHDWTEHKG